MDWKTEKEGSWITLRLEGLKSEGDEGVREDGNRGRERKKGRSGE